MRDNAAIKEAIKAVGSGAELARLLKVTRQAVEYYSRKGVPADRVLEVERVSKIPRHRLRPDLYPTIEH